MKLTISTVCTFASLAVGMLTASPAARADDIDIFVDNASGGGAPNIMFLVDNSSNWSKASQQWPDQPNQGQAETDAIVRVAAQFYTDKNGDPTATPVKVANPNAPSVNIGVAMLMTNRPDSSGHGGGYIRFAPRDITVLENLQALAKIVGYGKSGSSSLSAIPYPLTVAAPAASIYNNVNGVTEKIDELDKDESAAMYEVYKYYYSLNAFAGQASVLNAAQSPTAKLCDYQGAATGLSGALTIRDTTITTGYALNSAGTKYTFNGASCSKQYIVYIANNAQRNSPWPSAQTYESTSATGPISNINGWTSWTPPWTAKLLNDFQITTYVLDAYNAQRNADYSKTLQSAAALGGGKYFQVGTEAAIIRDLTAIVLEIQSKNSAFAATSLPASATNRSVDQNEVFLGVFRPDGNAAPRWYGNLKRFKLIINNGVADLGDALGVSAINSQTGFVADCSASFWTSDTSGYAPASGVTVKPYWKAVGADQPNPASTCPAPPNSLNPASNASFAPPSGVTWDKKSDLPDGPFVEKGGAAEVLRRGNVASSATATWQVNRTIKTVSGSTLVDFNSSTSGLSLAALGVPATDTTTTLGKLVDYVRGWDTNDDAVNVPEATVAYTNPNDSTTTETRPSIHADVIHSTPLPVTYNSASNGVMIYYGANDGMYHAVNAASGKEAWAFLAPEFFSRMYRLYTNSPQILYPNLVGLGLTPAPTPKDYGFDGSTGIYQSADNSQIWIYPSMRRGGRMIYAFDVSPSGGNPPATPALLWKAGCPNLANDTGCTSGMTGIGQTWSTPQAGRIKNGTTDTVAAPVVVIGGGYDSTPTNGDGRSYTSCEDLNTRSPSCSGRKGNLVYILDAHAGTVVKTFSLPSGDGRNPGSVAGDVALLDANNDGFVDYAYLADTNGFVYRIDFVDGPTTLNPVASSSWAIHTVASTTGAGRKFLFAPTLFFNQNKVYVGLGTGDREHPLISQYPYTSPVHNRFYLFVDDPSSTSTILNLDGSTMENATTATCTEPNVLPTTGGTLDGWYKDLTGGDGNNLIGEQVVTPAVIVSGQVSWGTNRPLAPVSGSCNNVLGEARGYLVDLVNGSGSIGVTGICGGASSTTYVGGGLPPPPSVGIVQVPDPVTGDPVYEGVCIGCPPKGGGPGSTIQPGNPFTANLETRRRVYWFTPNDK